jgi:O-6-methylguanine DNA methyltransferase
MKQRRTSLPCGFQEEALIAAALDDVDAPQQQAIQAHMAHCQTCRSVFETYCCLQQVFTRLQETKVVDAVIEQAREKLLQVLPPIATPRLRYRQMESGLGTLYIAASARGVPLVAWRDKATQLLASPDTWEDAAGPAVLRLTAEIPYGTVMSYQGLAAALGQPKAVRAVAQALRRNPVAIVIPCHRVVGKTGHLTGYAGGLERKQALLAHEGVPLVTRSGGIFIDKAHMYVGWRAERAYCKPHCPSLASLPLGDMLLVSPEAIMAHSDFVPCDVCHPEVASA